MCAKMAQTILVVDDDRTFVKLMEGFLEDEGYRVVTAGNGAEGLQRAFVENPDLAILDVRMPEMDGLELCRRIRDRSHIPIIMLTAKAEDRRGSGVGAWSRRLRNKAFWRTRSACTGTRPTPSDKGI